MDYIASTYQNVSAPFIAINLAPICDVGAIATEARIQKILMRQGNMLLKLRELIPVVKYCMNGYAKVDMCRQIILGIDHKSLTSPGAKKTMENPMFCHLLHSKSTREIKGEGVANQSVESSLFAAKYLQEVEAIISNAIARKISTLAAIDYHEIDLERDCLVSDSIRL